MEDVMWAGAEAQAGAGGRMCPQMMMDDDFMLYVYKVRPCDRKGAHSWTECPFTHPGEKAARRCPRTHVYSAEPCPDARKSGKCARGDACPYSHGVFEQWLNPSRYRTQLCSFGVACRRPVCFFAHTVQELRVPTACGPAPAAAAAAQQAAAVAAAAASACANPLLPGSMDLMLQQALLAQMQGAPTQVDGPTATLINRYQAASCAALANAAACQRQQQQHQAAAAAAAAAAIAAAASNPSHLLSMAQAAQAYQAAAAAAAAAAANVPFNNAASSSGLQVQLPPTSMAFGGSSGASSPTCGSGMSQMSAYGLPPNSDAGSLLSSGSRGGSDAAELAAANNYLLQQALLAAGAASHQQQHNGSRQQHAASPLPHISSTAASPLLSTWGLPAGSAGFGALGPYPSSLLPATPAASDTSMGSAGTNGSRGSMSCSVDALAPHLQRQLSLFQN